MHHCWINIDAPKITKNPKSFHANEKHFSWDLPINDRSSDFLEGKIGLLGGKQKLVTIL